MPFRDLQRSVSGFWPCVLAQYFVPFGCFTGIQQNVPLFNISTIYCFFFFWRRKHKRPCLKNKKPFNAIKHCLLESPPFRRWMSHLQGISPAMFDHRAHEHNMPGVFEWCLARRMRWGRFLSVFGTLPRWGNRVWSAVCVYMPVSVKSFGAYIDACHTMHAIPFPYIAPIQTTRWITLHNSVWQTMQSITWHNMTYKHIHTYITCVWMWRDLTWHDITKTNTCRLSQR